VKPFEPSNHPSCDSHRQGAEAPGHSWTVLLGLATLLLCWVAIVEVPSRAGAAVTARAETVAAQLQLAAALEQQYSVALLRAEREQLEIRLAGVAGVAASSNRPSDVLQFLEDAAATLGLTVLEVRPLDVQDGPSPTGRPLRLRLRGDFEGVRTFLRYVENSQSSVRVREVTLKLRDPGSAHVEAQILIGLVVIEGATEDATNAEVR
jgi:Tfp pilus assembly protein PilO